MALAESCPHCMAADDGHAHSARPAEVRQSVGNVAGGDFRTTPGQTSGSKVDCQWPSRNGPAAWKSVNIRFEGLFSGGAGSGRGRLVARWSSITDFSQER